MHAVAEEGIPTKQIADAIGAGLGVPVRSVDPADAASHFGWVGRFFAGDIRASSAVTREGLGWTPTGPTLLEDLAGRAYFEARLSLVSELGFGQVAIDCENAARLADFWSNLLGRPVEPGANEFYALIPASPDRTFPPLMFLQVPEARTGKNRWHLDLFSADPAAHVARAIELGATQHGDYDEFGAKWTTLSDPEGNVFDIGLAHD